MGKCVICGKESGKGRTCGSTCRQRLSRSVTKGVTDVTVEIGSVTVTTPNVIPLQPRPSRTKPAGMGDNEWSYIQMKAEQE